MDKYVLCDEGSDGMGVNEEGTDGKDPRGESVGATLEGTAIMTTPSSVVLFSILIFGLIFLFRCVKQGTHFQALLFFYISIPFIIIISLCGLGREKKC